MTPGYDAGKKLRPLKDFANSAKNSFMLLELLLVTSQLELKVKELFRKVSVVMQKLDSLGVFNVKFVYMYNVDC